VIVNGHDNVTIVLTGALGVGDKVGLGDEDLSFLPSGRFAGVAVINFDDGVELGLIL
jgi:hypothetical protein